MPDCTRIVAVPAVNICAAGMVAVIEVLPGLTVCVSVTAEPPGGVKNTTGDPPTRKLDPAMVMDVAAAPLSTLLGVTELITGAAIKISPGPEGPAVVVTRNEPVPTAVKRFDGTLTVIDPVVGALVMLTLVADPPGGVKVAL